MVAGRMMTGVSGADDGPAAEAPRAAASGIDRNRARSGCRTQKAGNALFELAKITSVMLHLAVEAFYPAPLPFPLLHVGLTWSFGR